MQDILPPLAETNADPTNATLDTEDISLPMELEFVAVPRHAKRSNGLTAERQRIFIRLLAECGSVRTACKAISCSSHAMYHLRNSDDAEGFAAAWDKAVQRGARRVLDILVDQAINGTPEKIYKDGELVAERRRYNTRAMMWIVAHYMPERFGVSGGLMHAAHGPVGMKRLKDAWRLEWQKELEENKEKYDAESQRNREVVAERLHDMRERMKSLGLVKPTQPEGSEAPDAQGEGT